MKKREEGATRTREELIAEIKSMVAYVASRTNAATAGRCLRLAIKGRDPSRIMLRAAHRKVRRRGRMSRRGK